jgi:hypothetical protein
VGFRILSFNQLTGGHVFIHERKSFYAVCHVV